MGIVVYNPQALKSHCLPFIGQEGPKLEMYDAILYIYDPLLKGYSTFLGNRPILKIAIHIHGGITL